MYSVKLYWVLIMFMIIKWNHENCFRWNLWFHWWVRLYLYIHNKQKQILQMSCFMSESFYKSLLILLKIISVLSFEVLFHSIWRWCHFSHLSRNENWSAVPRTHTHTHILHSHIHLVTYCEPQYLNDSNLSYSITWNVVWLILSLYFKIW